MHLRYVTMSDPRENLSIQDTIQLLQISPLAELGIQAHPSAMAFGRPRYSWMNELLYAVEGLKNQPSLALHVNYEWCDLMAIGLVPTEIASWISRTNNITHKPLINRIQLNIGDNTTAFKLDKVITLFKSFPDREFILPFNQQVKPKIDVLRQYTKQFKLLFDSSYGIGKSPEHWESPAYNDIKFGYAGGMSPENVKHNLDNISGILPKEYKIWIDAEGQLRRSGAFNIELARNYLLNALEWNQSNER